MNKAKIKNLKTKVQCTLPKNEKRHKWSCGACGGSDDTGCLSSTGECYR